MSKYASRSLTFEALVRFHEVAKIPLFAIALSKVHGVAFTEIIKKCCPDFSEFEKDLEIDCQNLENTNVTANGFNREFDHGKLVEKPINDQEDEFIAIGDLAWYGVQDWALSYPEGARKKFYVLLHHPDIYFGMDFMLKSKSKDRIL